MILFAITLSGQSGLTGSCPYGGSYPYCVGGEIRFTGTGYGATVRVTVKKSSGQVIDDGEYTTNSGVLSFVENLSFADTYEISINGHVVLTVTTGQ